MTPPARLFVLASVLAIATASRAADAWTSALTKRGIDPALVENPIAQTPEIRAAAESFSGRGGGTGDQLKRIQTALFDTSRFTFDYDSMLTETAAEALSAARGNCVSFTNLFIALARSRGFRVSAGYIQPRAVGEK